ncbi:co(2)-response secreted protease [Phtheirospermum japonicum]|uniref:Co(2)-response secreted protease n=1 Tax=Phtheirospermum japonicum TaxID=374723 RepID=A0A830CF77_9LAMI|nr:co(2)-response secreted protease [Phtheirospermum japonicum]
MKRKKNHIIHTYNKSFVGFAARLSVKEAKLIAQKPGVVSVFPNQVAQPQTTRSWDFLMSQYYAFKINDSTTPTSSHSQVSWSTGADTIIGIIDTGIWPEHPSFNDKYMRPIPLRWKGICMPGEEITCNRKVIGARYYDNLDEPGSMGTTRDDNGHGTHVASIASGNYVWRASYYGLAQGTPRGGSPSSRIAAYRVCGSDGRCMGSAILKAYDDAIADGVDVISVSLGWWSQVQDPFIHDPILIGAFHAAEKGVLVVGSAGNGGPSPGTVEKVFPWILTVAATSIDRHFEAAIVLGPNMVIKGGGINFSDLNKFAIYPLVDGRSAGSCQTDVADASNCVPGSLDDDKVKGKIVLCEHKVKGRKFDSLKSQGAIGMILIDDIQSQVPFQYGTSPIAAVSEEDGARIRFYINSTSNALATILPTRSVIRSYKPAPVVPFFSPRGPPAYGLQNLIKPDVAAPGLAILAAWPPFNDSSRPFPGKEPSLFNINSGTSMACPHVSGLAATVKSHHPTWTPDIIRSAIMTTATQKNNLNAPITTDTGSRATPYDIGAGEISVFGSLWPGLVYETKATDYIQFLCNMGYNASVIKTIASTVPNNFACPSNSNSDLISDMNYPSISVSGLEANGRRTVTRTLTNVGEQYSIYTVTVEAPDSMHVQVVPKILRFTKTAKKLSFQVTFTLTKFSQEDLFGSITWCSRNYKVRSPFAVSSA